MAHETATPRLSGDFAKALVFAAIKHHTQVRKGGDTPYLGHLLSVAGLVIEARGTEAQAIAALLHDSAEDAGGEETLSEIADNFGNEVAAIVRECSDTVVTPKPPWEQRKRNYLEHLSAASDSAITVSLADKLDNARALVRDFQKFGSELWERFTVHDPQQHLWYYDSLLSIYRERAVGSWMVDELGRALNELRSLLAAAS